MTAQQVRRRLGEVFPAFELETLAHGRLVVPEAGLTHLQFRRFAGCPICNLQVRRFAQAHAELSAAEVRTVSLFYSSREAMLDYQHELPLPVVADPDRRLFDVFGVERSPWAAAHPQVWATAISGLLTGPSNPFEGGAQDGLPADFLLARGGTRTEEPQCQIVALHYGSTADDQWSVSEVLRLARTHATRATTSLSPPRSTTRKERDHEPTPQ